MKKFLVVLIILLSLLTGYIPSTDAHCKGPHGPIDYPHDKK